MPKPQVPNVLIVENQSGNVFIVENQGETSQVDKILKNSENSIQKPEEMIIEEYLDEEYLQLEEDLIKVEPEQFEFTLIDPNCDESVVLKDHPYTTITDQQESLFDIEEDENIIIEEVFEQDQSRSKKQHHKTHQLTGKAACKYCETVFKNKEQKNAHDCQYLQCNPRNFICRICNKELSKKTFSNHLHETLDCQYCSKSFVNPRNLKTHIRKQHKGADYVEPLSPDVTNIKELDIVDNESMEVLDEETGLIVNAKKEIKPKKKYPRKTGRFECDLCGRIFKTSQSLQQHLSLHAKNYRYVCETCGERFTTKTGIDKHACLNRKRRRPQKDFRTVDVRHCKYCDLWFSSLEETKEHECLYQFADDPKMFRCRFCNMDMSKNSYNKHIRKHFDQTEYVCNLCDKRLANESSLHTHLSTHSGDKSYKCDKCEKCFVNKTLLTRHSRFHGNEIPIFKCEICNREVASKYHLKTHYATMHCEDFACRICKDSFTSRDQLKAHYKNTHDPFVCKICEKSFILERYLKMHEKTHGNVTTQFFKCPYCHRKFSKRAIANHVFKMHRENFDLWRDENLELI